MEIWREIKGYADYQVSNYGNVKSKIPQFPKQLSVILLQVEIGNIFRPLQ